MKTYVTIKLQHEALHHWPEAREKLPEAGFLADKHRHVFHIKMTKEVKHDDRDVEFILWKREVESYLTEKYGKDLGRTSCEDLAKELLTKFDCTMVSVEEDAENGALVTI